MSAICDGTLITIEFMPKLFSFLDNMINNKSLKNQRQVLQCFKFIAKKSNLYVIRFLVMPQILCLQNVFKTYNHLLNKDILVLEVATYERVLNWNNESLNCA